MEALPYIRPLLIHSTVLVPMMLLGGSKDTRGSWEVRLTRASADTAMPVVMRPPR